MKSFIYLDEYKMYSISSQIFEGLTDYILQSTSNTVEEIDEQKQRPMSGRIMANILSTRSNQTERRFLHDYAYTLFENKLIADNNALTININNITLSILDIHEAKFIKVTGKAVFNDTKLVHELIASFNQRLRALRYVENSAQIEQTQTELLNQVNTIPNRDARAKQKARVNSAIKHAKKADGELSEEFAKNLELVIKELYQDQLLFQILIDDFVNINIFSASLNRDNLKEDIAQLIYKYGRATEKEFTMFGILAQSGKDSIDTLNFVEDKISEGGAGLRLALLNVISLMNGMDKTVIGRIEKEDLQEYIIDPIAIYYQL